MAFTSPAQLTAGNADAAGCVASGTAFFLEVYVSPDERDGAFSPLQTPGHTEEKKEKREERKKKKKKAPHLNDFR